MWRCSTINLCADTSSRNVRWSAMLPIEMTVRAWNATEMELTYRLKNSTRLVHETRGINTPEARGVNPQPTQLYNTSCSSFRGPCAQARALRVG